MIISKGALVKFQFSKVDKMSMEIKVKFNLLEVMEQLELILLRAASSWYRIRTVK